MPWDKDGRELTNFSFANKVHDPIKFTTVSSTADQIPFFDVLVMRKDKVETSVYSKYTDNHSYLYFSSVHPSVLVTILFSR